MSEIIVKGLVKRCGEEESVSSSFTKRELVVVTEEQYPQYISINFTQGKCNPNLDKCKPNTRISVSINLRGREWINPQGESKYFNEIQGWKIAFDTTPSATAPAPVAAQPAQTAAPAAPVQNQESFFNDDEENIF